MRMHLKWTVAGLGTIMAFWSPVEATPFTFAPGAANPALGGGTFTADKMLYTNNVFAVVQSNTSFVAHNDPITGFSLNGNPMVPTNFGSAYGLYFDIIDTGFSTPSSLAFTSSTVIFKADPGNQNGTLTSTTSGNSFANLGANGTADDIVLATATMLWGVAGLNPATGVRTTHFQETLSPAAGEGGFFVSSTDLLDFLNTTNPGQLINTPVPEERSFRPSTGGLAPLSSCLNPPRSSCCVRPSAASPWYTDDTPLTVVTAGGCQGI